MRFISESKLQIKLRRLENVQPLAMTRSDLSANMHCNFLIITSELSFVVIVSFFELISHLSPFSYIASFSRNLIITFPMFCSLCSLSKYVYDNLPQPNILTIHDCLPMIDEFTVLNNYFFLMDLHDRQWQNSWWKFLRFGWQRKFHCPGWVSKSWIRWEKRI